MTDTAKTTKPTDRFGVQASAEKTEEAVQQSLRQARHEMLKNVETGKAEATAFLHDAASEATQHMTAMTKSYSDLSSGIIAMQQACFEYMTRTFNRDGKRKPQDIFTCRTLTDVTELQQALYKDAMENMVQLNSTLTQLVTRMTTDATKPVQQTAKSR